jgi:hypothetical protein
MQGIDKLRQAMKLIYKDIWIFLMKI